METRLFNLSKCSNEQLLDELDRIEKLWPYISGGVEIMRLERYEVRLHKELDSRAEDYSK